MKKYLAFALPLFVVGLSLFSAEIGLANIGPKRIAQMRPVKLVSATRITVEPVEGKEKVTKLSPKNKAVRLASLTRTARIKREGSKFVKNDEIQVTLRNREDNQARGKRVFIAPLLFANAPGFEERLGGLRRHYQDWRGTRYQAGGSSHTGVDCSGFTALTFRDVYGINLPRTAREQAMRGMPVDRDSLLPGDLVFFKRERGGDHVGIYLGNGKFMHASTRQGVIISSMHNTYWRDKFWKGSRL